MTAATARPDTAAMPPIPSRGQARGTAADFDFLVGRWAVRHRRLKARLAGCTDWEEFGGTSTLHPLMDGRANVDDNLIELPGGSYRAVSLRAFDPAAGEWAIWWLDGRTPHTIDVPVRGGFRDGVGAFYADETFEGRPIVVRFVWSHVGRDAARWQQAFSADAGLTWETNWVMDFERLGGPA